VKFGLDVATTGDWSDPRRLVELAVAAEAGGWDGCFLWDVMLPEGDAPVADPWVALAAIATATERIRLGVMLTPLPRRQPWEVARQLATLDQLSEGRMVFGAGLGWQDEEFRRLGLPSEARIRGQRLDESLELIDRLWTGESVTFDGEHYALDGVRLLPRPVQRPRIPVWCAAGWPRRTALRRAIRWDGVYLMTDNQATHERISPDDVRAVAELVAAERTAAGPFEIAVNVSTMGEADGGAAITAAMAAAGATWIIDLTPDTFDEHLALARRGPAR
jgi:alkanesulfonate monooxygenase SsuD/methylene tetrahydromethanopterin reductase-like flavin-dependent oxidoreductase (luciferase family)